MAIPLIDVQWATAEENLQGSTWLIYNDILLTDVLTESYEMQEIRTPDGSQVVAIHHTLKITAIINPQINSFSNIPAPPSSVYRTPRTADEMPMNITILRDRLMLDRQILRWSVGGKKVLESPPQRDDAPGVHLPCDSMQGPKPLYCQITQITGTSAFYVRFGVETWVDKCVYENSESVRVVQSHRFSMTHDVDGDTWLTSRSVQGHVRFRPEVLQLLANVPDQIVRDWAHPVPPGFKRQNVKVQALPNGMELAYSFVDVEQTLPLGSLSPATKLSAEYSVASSLAEGKPALTQIAIHVSALGPKNQYRFNLLAMAIRIAMRKLQKPDIHFASDIVVTYSLDNTFVDLSIKAVAKPVGIGLEGLQVNNIGLTQTQDLEDLDNALSPYRAAGEALQATQANKAIAPRMNNNETRGTSVLMIIGSDIINGCYTLTRPANYAYIQPDFGQQAVSMNSDSPGQNLTASLVDNNGEEVGLTLSIVPALTIPLASTGLSAESFSGTGIYEDWQIDTRYMTNHQRAVLPVGMTQGASPGDVLTYVPPQVATLGFPYTLKVVNWSVAWMGPDPSGIILPSPETEDSNDVLLAEDVTPAVPSICNSSNKAWRISGTYWYVCLGMHTVSITEKSRFDYTDEGIAIGKSITDPAVQSANTIGMTRFVAGYSPSFV